MFNKLLISICLTVFSFTSIAQDSSPHHVGVSAGFTTGFGLSYRYWPSKLGIQVTALPTFIKNQGSLTSFGASALYTLHEGSKIDLYSYLGNSIILEKNSNQSNVTYNAGVGFGLKFNIFDELNVNAQFGYGGLNLTDKYSSFTMVGEIGFYYHL